MTNGTDSSITEYAPGSTGNATPSATISGDDTGLDDPAAIVVDPAGDVFIANENSSTVEEFAPGASGDATPAATISGSNTGLDGPDGLALNAAGDLYVANLDGDSVVEFGPGASGNATPILTLSSSGIEDGSPLDGLAFNSAGDMFVAMSADDGVGEFAPGASGDAGLVNWIAGASDGLYDPVDVAIDSSGNLWVANSGNGSIGEYPPGANGEVFPVDTISGSDTGLSYPDGLQFDASGNLWVSDQNAESVMEFAPGATGDATPTTTITGSDTGLDGPSDLAVAGAPPTPTKLAFVAQPSKGSAGALLAEPKVAVEDAAGDVLTGNTSKVTLSIKAGTGASGATLKCTSNPVAASGGVAAFPGCRINLAGSGYQLQATDGSLAAADSSAFTINPGPAYKLAFVTEPSGGQQFLALSPQPAVAIEDREGNVVTSNTSKVTLSIKAGTGASGAALICTSNPVAASAGIGTFARCAINKVGNDYQLAASDGSLVAATSAKFDVTLQVISSFTWSSNPIAAPASLGPDTTVTRTVTALTAAGRPAADVLVYVSLIKPAPSIEPVGFTDNSSATCGTGKNIVRLPAYCQANSAGEVEVTYQTSSHRELGSDELIAAVDPFGTDQAADPYTYSAPVGTPIASYSWNPDPIAPAESLASGESVPITVTALSAEGNPIPGAPVYLRLTEAPGSNAKISSSCNGTTTAESVPGLAARPASTPAPCSTGRSGSLTITYTSSTKTPTGGSDGVTAGYPKVQEVTDVYSYD